MPIVIVIGVIGLLLTLYIGYRASISDRKLFSVSLLALFAGLLFESIRVSGSWKTVAGIFALVNIANKCSCLRLFFLPNSLIQKRRNAVLSAF